MITSDEREVHGMCKGFIVTYVNDNSIDGYKSIFVPTTEKKDALLYVSEFLGGEKRVISCVTAIVTYSNLSASDLSKIYDRRKKLNNLIERMCV